MNIHEIISAYEEAGITANDVANALRIHAEIKKAYEEVESDYPTRCAQTPLLAAMVDTKRTSQAKLAEDAKVTSMTMGRWCAAGRVLIVHPGLDPVAMVAYANIHNKKECHALTLMSEEDAADVITPKKEKSQKTEAEKDLAAIEAVMRRIRKAGEAGDRQRVEALDSALTTVLDTVKSAYDAIDGESAEDVA